MLKQMKHKIRIALILCLSFLLIIPMVNLKVSYAAEEKAARKIISVVYDDSGSMSVWPEKTTKWAQANYAMQSFAALLNEQDEMYITYMSDAAVDEDTKEYLMDVNKTVKLDMNDVDGAVRQIQNKIGQGDTPVQAIDVAVEKLNQIEDSDPMTQYWLVILTDGQMFPDANENPNTLLQDNLNQQYKGMIMPNGSPLYITYLGIGKDAQVLAGDPDNHFMATTTTDIVDAMSLIANQISGRTLFDSKYVEQKDARTITVHTDIPLYSIAVFSQHSEAIVDQVSDVSGIRNVSVRCPESPKDKQYLTDDSLYGNAALIQNRDGTLIQTGDYTITFSSDVNLEDTVIMYQPAIQMTMKITRDGTGIDETELEDVLKEGDRIDIELVPTNPENGEIISDGDLPDGISWEVSYNVDGIEAGYSASRILQDVEVKTGENVIVSSMSIPDMVPQERTLSFTLKKPVVYKIDMNGTSDAVYHRGKMGRDNCLGTPITLSVTGDGAPVSGKEFKQMRLKVTDVSVDDSKVKGNFFETSGWKLASTATHKEESSSFIVYPRSTLFPFLVKPGDYKVAVELILPDGSVQTAEGTYTVVGHWQDWLFVFVLAALLFLIIYILYILFGKAKFRGQMVTIKVYTSDRRGGGIEEPSLGTHEVLKRFPNWKVLLPGPSVYKIKGMIFTASKDGSVYMKRNSIRRFERYGSSRLKPEKQFSRIVQNLKVSDDKIPEMKYLSNMPFYLYQNGGYLYSVTIENRR